MWANRRSVVCSAAAVSDVVADLDAGGGPVHRDVAMLRPRVGVVMGEHFQQGIGVAGLGRQNDTPPELVDPD
jgi:hypothetical protein